MASNSQTNELQQLLTDPRFESLPPEAQLSLRVKYFEKKVAGSSAYQQAGPKQQAQMKIEALGGYFEDVPAAETNSLGVLDEALGAVKPDIRGALAARAQAPGPGFLERATAPGGLLSPEAQGTVGGGLIGGALGGPPGAIIGAGIGAMGGRGYEMATDPRGQPAGLAAGVEDLGNASQRGLLAETIGQGLGVVASGIGNKLLRPRGAPVPEMLSTMGAAQEAQIPMTAGQLTGSRGLQLAEEIPQRVILGGKRAQQFTKAQLKANEEAVLRLAEAKSPGVQQDWSEVGAGLQSAVKGREREAQSAVSSLYDHAKNLVGDGQFAMANLEQAAGGVVKTEKPLATLASSALRTAKPFSAAPPDPVQAALAEAGFESGKTYSFGDILAVKQRLGDAIRRSGSRTVQRELSQLQTAVAQDLRDAADAAGASEAIPIIERANKFYFTKLVPTFRDPGVLKATAARPSVAAAMYLKPGVPVEAIDALHRAAGPEQFKKITRAWYENLLQKSSLSGEFDAGQFAQQVRKLQPETVRAITRGQSHEFNQLIDIFEKEALGTIGGGSRSALSTGQLIPLVTAAASGGLGLLSGAGLGGSAALMTSGAGAGLAIPQVLGKILYSERGIRWLTIGLKAPAGSKASVKAIAELVGIASTRSAQQQ